MFLRRGCPCSPGPSEQGHLLQVQRSQPGFRNGHMKLSYKASSDFLIWDTPYSTESHFCWLRGVPVLHPLTKYFPLQFHSFWSTSNMYFSFSPPIVLYLLLYSLLLFNGFISVTQRLLLYMRSGRSSSSSQPHTQAVLCTSVFQGACLWTFYIEDNFSWQLCPVVEINHSSWGSAWTSGMPKTESLTSVCRDYLDQGSYSSPQPAVYQIPAWCAVMTCQGSSLCTTTLWNILRDSLDEFSMASGKNEITHHLNIVSSFSFRVSHPFLWSV